MTETVFLPNGAAQVIVLVLGRLSGGYTFELPPMVRDSSLTTMFISKT